MKRWIILLIIAGLLIGGYFGIQYYNSQQQQLSLSDLQTTPAARGSLTAMVGATGTVRANQMALLVWQTSGTVEGVNVAVGESVAAGQTLGRLEQASLSQAIILARADLVNAQKTLDDLLNSQTAQAAAQQAVSSARKTVIEAERLTVKYDEQKYKDDLEKAREDIVAAQDNLKKAKDDFEPYKDWEVDNETRKSFQQKVDDAQRKYDDAVRALDLLELEKELALAGLTLAQARLSDAEREYERLKDGPDPNDVAALQARIDAAQAALDLASLEAAFDGTITQIDTLAGDRVSPGATAFRIDDLSRLLVEVRISEVDINRVIVGQEAILTFDAVSGKEYHGVVSEVAQFGLASQGGVEFAVTVELTDADEDVRPGMTAAVNIVVEQLDNVLLVPNRAVRVRNGQRVVYVIRNSRLEAVNITLGSSSDTDSQVVDGELVAGDVIVLNPPSVFDTDGPPPFVR